MYLFLSTGPFCKAPSGDIGFLFKEINSFIHSLVTSKYKSDRKI